MLNQFSRTQLILGKEAIKELQTKTVCVFGIGGVGGNVCDALARSGVRNFVLVDDDKVCITNINRQLIANINNIGKDKVDAMEEHLKSINPFIKVEKKKCFYLPENRDEFDFSKYDYVVDAIDTVTAKVDIIVRCKENNIPIISALGCGNRVDPTKLEVTDIYKTSYDPLAKVMRHELRKRNIKSLKVVYSKEEVLRPLDDLSISCRAHCVCPEGTIRHCTDRRDIPGSTAFVPPVAGIIIASEVVKDLINFDRKNRK